MLEINVEKKTPTLDLRLDSLLDCGRGSSAVHLSGLDLREATLLRVSDCHSWGKRRGLGRRVGTRRSHSSSRALGRALARSPARGADLGFAGPRGLETFLAFLAGSSLIRSACAAASHSTAVSKQRRRTRRRAAAGREEPEEARRALFWSAFKEEPKARREWLRVARGSGAHRGSLVDNLVVRGGGALLAALREGAGKGTGDSVKRVGSATNVASAQQASALLRLQLRAQGTRSGDDLRRPWRRTSGEAAACWLLRARPPESACDATMGCGAGRGSSSTRGSVRDRRATSSGGESSSGRNPAKQPATSQAASRRRQPARRQAASAGR